MRQNVRLYERPHLSGSPSVSHSLSLSLSFFLFLSHSLAHIMEIFYMAQKPRAKIAGMAIPDAIDTFRGFFMPGKYISAIAFSCVLYFNRSVNVRNAL